MAVSAVWRRVYFLAPCPSEPKEQTAAHRRDALCPSTKIQKQAAFGITRDPRMKERKKPDQPGFNFSFLLEGQLWGGGEFDGSVGFVEGDDSALE